MLKVFGDNLVEVDKCPKPVSGRGAASTMAIKPFRMLDLETSTVPLSIQTYASTMVWDSVIPFTEQQLTAETQSSMSTTEIDSTVPDPHNPDWHQETTFESLTGKVLYTHANSGQRFNGRYGRSAENFDGFENFQLETHNSENQVAINFYLLLVMIIYWLNILYLRYK